MSITGINISLTGASSVGKSTLINVLREEFRDFTVQTESVRYLKDKYGLDFRSGDTALQLALLNLQTNLLLINAISVLRRYCRLPLCSRD